MGYLSAFDPHPDNNLAIERMARAYDPWAFEGEHATPEAAESARVIARRAFSPDPLMHHIDAPALWVFPDEATS